PGWDRCRRPSAGVWHPRRRRGVLCHPTPREQTMAVDVVTDVVIDRPPAEVAAYAGDPNNAPEWYENIRSVEWQTPPPIALGSRLEFVASFLGRRLAYTYEVAEWEPGA